MPPFDDDLIVERVGEITADRGWDYMNDDRVVAVTWSPQANALTGVVQGNRTQPYRCMVLFHPSHARPRIIASTCSCPMRQDCKHVAAILFEAMDADLDGDSEADEPVGRPVRVSPPKALPIWRTRLTPLLAATDLGAAAPREHRALGLQVRVKPASIEASNRWGAGRAGLDVRPVVLGKKGRWVQGGLTWQNLSYSHDAGTPRQRTLLRQLVALLGIDSPYLSHGAWLPLERVSAPVVWIALEEIVDGGISLVNDDREQSPVALPRTPTHASIDIAKTDGGLVVTVPVHIDGEVVDASRLGFVSSPATGVFVWDVDEVGGPTRVRLGRLDSPITEAVATLATQPEVQVPAAEVTDFLREALPLLRARHLIGSRDGSFTLPPLPHPILEVHVTHHGKAQAAVMCRWRYALPGEDPAASPHCELRSTRPGDSTHPGDSTILRDADEEARILEQVSWLIDEHPHLRDSTEGTPRLASAVLLTGLPMIAFARDALPRLASDEHVLVTVAGEAVDYRETSQSPVITVRTSPRQDSRDWFDLGITVSIEEQEVPFDELFRALAADDEVLVLANGTYVRLDRPELTRLHTLIEEARSLQEHVRDGLGISRYHVDLWDELEQLGVIDDQASAWREALAALTDASRIPARDLPPTVNATLRPYQADGFAWLAHLFDHGLGGILADDMGLGKTLQVIALIAADRSAPRPLRSAPPPPWVVVAPASVVHNWASEMARFCPSLRVVTIQETSAKRGSVLAEELRHCDVVVVSYTLFRLDFDEFERLEFRGLILDEAQFVKNHQSKSYACARRLSTPLKLAVTGTPMENNLMELWSLLSITAPGLFPNPKRFSEYYQHPIEREGDETRLALLRSRIRPFMLRRTKEDVAADLPAKQEQILELDLAPRHRKIYDVQLQRERQRVLGLLGDMDTNRFQIFQSLTLLRQLSLDASLVDEKYSGIPSAKLDALMEMLDDVLSEGHRVLVFSQFTRYLRMARARLDVAGVRYAYLDGRTRNRARAIDDFRSGAAPVFLISLKAGGFGLNLTEADYVILLDPWWNPATEAQAVDRVHRIGQNRSVMVYRLVSRDTIEEKVMALKAEKAALFSGVMGDGRTGGTGITAEDVRELLG